MKKTRGTQNTVDVNDNINVTLGSVDRDNPKTIYIKFSAWGNTIDYDDNLDYKIVIRKLAKEIKRFLFFNLNENIFNKKYFMVDMDMRESGITSDKSSYMSCEVTLYQLNNYLLSSEILNDVLLDLTKHLCNEVFNKVPHFKFYKEKKQAKKKLEIA